VFELWALITGKYNMEERAINNMAEKAAAVHSSQVAGRLDGCFREAAGAV